MLRELAARFGLGVLVFAGPQYGGEFFAGWITEYSPSVDNLFVFVLIMANVAVPRQFRQTVLLLGIALALVLRGVFIAVGAEAIARFDWVFSIFGTFLLFTAWELLSQKEDEEEEFTENAALRAVRRFVTATEEYRGAKISVRVGGRRVVTPMLRDGRDQAPPTCCSRSTRSPRSSV